MVASPDEVFVGQRAEADVDGDAAVRRAVGARYVGPVSRPGRSVRTPGNLPARCGTPRAELTEQITAVHSQSRGTYGAPRVHAVLKREGTTCGRERIARLTRATGLAGRHRRRRHRTTIPTRMRPPP
ncbi:transposase [Streptomyces sp. NPDC015220]|uniref:transposase n=1 Tax=Streptomyces sp. NPDC015220 TaxID=3364947 RepID=UPI0036F71C90